MDAKEFIRVVQPYTMTPMQRIECLYHSMEYIKYHGIKGDYVECGVWKGGNVLGMIKFLESNNNFDPNIWLYDTFFGMTMPEDQDIDHFDQKASEILEHVLCMNSLEEVQDLIESNTKYPKNKIKYIVGDVCKTLLNSVNVPDKIALLRLDTDWYNSTKTELEVLWDKLEVGAPCIIDDYGHWQGCKKAVDEFLASLPCKHELIYADYTCVVTYKVC